MMAAQPRPRTEFAALRDQMRALAAGAGPAPQPAKKLAPWTDADDFHSLLAYVRTFT